MYKTKNVREERLKELANAPHPTASLPPRSGERTEQKCRHDATRQHDVTDEQVSMKARE